MKVVLREDESGVSEVIGTILILAMTVVLFSTIIVWVSSIPGPVAQTRLDIQGTLTPKFGTGAQLGLEVGDYVNLTHNGGEALQPGTTVIYIVDQKGSANSTTYTLRLHLLQSGATPNGLLDGADSVWNVGERWTYFNALFSVSDKITVTIVDTSRSTVVWTSTLTPPAGTRPPIFLNVWANRYLGVATISTPVTGAPVYIFGQVTDLDGDLNSNSVYAILAILYGTSNPCVGPQKMYDDGTNGDQTPFDGIFTLARTSCLNPDISWDGSLVLFNATDLKGHQSTTRMTLHVVPGPTGGTPGGGGNAGSGRPPNLRWNGNQGYNIFNATQWDQFGYQAQETRTFTGSDTVVIVVGSLTLENTFGIDTFNLWDPYSGNPSQAVVYGATKTVSLASAPSSQQSFTFFQFVNGYYVYTYRFKLNDAATVGTNFYTTPPQYPRYYHFAKYPLSMLLASSTNNKFSTTDSINITSTTGQLRSFPVIQTFADSGFTNPTASFKSTDTVYVKVRMFTVDAVITNVAFGNVLIQDFSGGSQVWRAPINGYQSNLPICPVTGSCSAGTTAISVKTVQNEYRFAVNLSRVNQDPWVPGPQNYALSISSVKDSDENYGTVTTQIIVTAPLYKMDVLVGSHEASQNAWGTSNYAFFFENFNGFDWWKPLRVDYCTAGTSSSGLSGSGVNCPTSTMAKVAFGDFNLDGTLDVAESINTQTSGTAVAIYRHGVDASGNTVYLPVFIDTALTTACTAITTADVTGDGAPEVLCGGANGNVWYYRNDGSWTKVWADQVTSSQINSIVAADFNGDGANDIAVGGNNGWLKYYPNLNRQGQFQSSGSISDNWVAIAEQTLKGTVAYGSYLTTYPAANSYEQLTEQSISVPLQAGTTLNGGFNSSTTNWAFGSVGSATGSWQSSGGNPAGYAQIVTDSAPSQVVGGYWQQQFNVSGSPPFALTLNLDYNLSTYGATGAGSVTFYAFVDSSPGAPLLGTNVWSQTLIAKTPSWPSASVSGSIINNRVNAPGSYWLKVAMYSTYDLTGSQTKGGFDNVKLAWSSTPGTTSALEQYWKMNTLPNRPGTNFNFYVTARATSSSDYDNYTFYYATNVVGNDPTTGTYTQLVLNPNGNVTTNNATRTAPLPSTLAGLTVWIKVVDTNRYQGFANLDSLYVYQMYINANTPASSGATLSVPDAGNVNSINAGFPTGGIYASLLAGTSKGNVYRYNGTTGGLVSPVSAFYSAGTTNSIVGVKWANISALYPGLEVVVAYGSTVKFLTAYGPTGIPFGATLSTGTTITALAVGDVNGDGPDDVVVGTSGGVVTFWANYGGGNTWSSPVAIYSVGAQVYSLVIGDSHNPQYMGR
ncbi:MAG: FG-GAP-like repeat-containing protein [Thermoplasmata archaeon]